MKRYERFIVYSTMIMALGIVSIAGGLYLGNTINYLMNSMLYILLFGMCMVYVSIKIRPVETKLNKVKWFELLCMYLMIYVAIFVYRLKLLSELFQEMSAVSAGGARIVFSSPASISTAYLLLNSNIGLKGLTIFFPTCAMLCYSWFVSNLLLEIREEG